tara:strand:- start:1159 stop:1683 length:525 start_codon:yes stop_codon:yes gene_type:complete
MEFHNANASFTRAMRTSLILGTVFAILSLTFSAVLLGLVVESFRPALIANLPDPINTQRGIAFASSLCLLLGVSFIDTLAIRSLVADANKEGDPVSGIVSSKTLMPKTKWGLLAFSAFSFALMPSNQNSVLLLNLALLLVLVNRAYVSYQVKQFIRELTKLGYISQKRAIQLNQ